VTRCPCSAHCKVLCCLSVMLTRSQVSLLPFLQLSVTYTVRCFEQFRPLCSDLAVFCVCQLLQACLYRVVYISVNQLLVRFQEAPRPCCCMPTFRNGSCWDVAEYRAECRAGLLYVYNRTVDCVLFGCRCPKILNTRNWLSLGCTGP